MEERIILFVAENIQSYLDKRPDAADTVEGIHKHWVDWLGEPGPIVITEMALKRLESDGIIKRVAVGTREMWRRKRG